MTIIQASRETSLVLDTDMFTHWRAHHPYALKTISDYQRRHKVYPALSSTTIFESLSGIEAEAAKGKDVEQFQLKAQQLIRNCIVLPFDQRAAAIAAYVFPRLSQSDRNKHWRDLFIAATALAHQYGIATGNRKDFELIDKCLPPNLRLHLAVWKP